MENPREFNILANIGAILFNLGLGLRLLYKYKHTDNENYREAFRIVMLALFASMMGGCIFLVLYLLRITNVIDDYALQGVARLVLLFFYFFVPSLIYFSLQNIRE